MPIAVKPEEGTIRESTPESRDKARVGNFFWIFIVLFTLAIIIGMVNPQPAFEQRSGYPKSAKLQT